MNNLMRADLFKLSKLWSIKILIGILFISAILMTMISYSVAQGDAGQELGGLGALFSDLQMMSLIGSIIAGIFIVGDFKNKTIHDAISTGSSRGTLIAGKTMVYFILVALMILPYALITSMAIFTTDHSYAVLVPSAFLNLLATSTGIEVTALEVLKMIAIFLTVIIVYAGQLSIAVWIAFVLRKTVLVILIGYGVSILSGQLRSLGDSVPMVEKILAFTPYGFDLTLLTLDAEVGVFFKGITISLVFIAIILTLTYVGFKKSEIN
ncbi:ABC transporter permease [Bacillus horti]|uniref:ABC-2 type transport system permease protein n=1 Tax=Caldalkalibacillus horti TaxID=77523 RepID=A0ABT9W0D8_9BACI|nr:ABC transporter permease [Bacillus horti]MDQ0166723.1 ABC-2 type transport system permease protein [Bacillus horti]